MCIDNIAASIFVDVLIELTNTVLEAKIPITFLIVRRGALSKCALLLSSVLEINLHWKTCIRNMYNWGERMYSYVVSIKFEPRSLRHLESKEQTFSHRTRIVCARAKPLSKLIEALPCFERVVMT